MKNDEELKCPICGSKLEILRTWHEGVFIKIELLCKSCNRSFIISAKPKEIKKTLETIELEDYFLKELMKKRVKIEEMPPDVPELIKKIAQSDHVFLINFSRVGVEAPKTGSNVSPEVFVKMSAPFAYAKRIADALRARNILRLYKFQETAMREILSGKNVVIEAATAMGKTEAFFIPLLIKICKEKPKEKPYALLIYPTKALSRDQLIKLSYYAKVIGARVAVLDGDTPPEERAKILRNPPEFIMTNFDMIHWHLAKRTPIGNLFRRARIIVIDEFHEYCGAFGTHAYWILKRLKRQKKIQIILSSATIKNSLEFAERFLDEKVILVKEEGRKTPIYIFFLYPWQLSIHRIAAEIAKESVLSKLKCLIFFNTRRSAEYAYWLYRYTFGTLSDRAAVHRAGISRKIRRIIEEKFRSGEILTIFSTPTLELGIDIGDVNLVVSEIAPVDRFLQRIGRSGRREKPGVGILLLRADDPISEYYALNPRDYFEDLAMRYIEPRNPYIAKQHVYLMAYEQPLSEEEIKTLRIPYEIIRELMKEGALVKFLNYYHANERVFDNYFKTSIRGSGDVIEVIWKDKKIDERDIIIGLRELYPGAIYFNRGMKFIVKKLDLENRKAYVELAPRDLEPYYTKPLFESIAIPIEEETYQKRELLGTVVWYGRLRMTLIVNGYIMLREGEKKPVGVFPIEPPITYEYDTYGIVFKAPQVDYGDWEKTAGAYHALEHVLIEGTTMITGAASEDLGGISFGTTGIICIHDALKGGNGVSYLLFKRFEKAVERACKLLRRYAGTSVEKANKAVYSWHCGNNNRPLYQRGALELLESMLRHEKVTNARHALDILKVLGKGIV